MRSGLAEDGSDLLAVATPRCVELDQAEVIDALGVKVVINAVAIENGDLAVLGLERWVLLGLLLGALVIFLGLLAQVAGHRAVRNHVLVIFAGATSPHVLFPLRAVRAGVLALEAGGIRRGCVQHDQSEAHKGREGRTTKRGHRRRVTSMLLQMRCDVEPL